MPEFLRNLNLFRTKDTAPVNRYEGFKGDGAVVLTDRRGTSKAEIPSVEEKSNGFNNPLEIYRPTSPKSIDASKAMANFTGWTYTAVNAIAEEISNIELRLFRVNGEEQQEIPSHDVLDLLDAVNESMTGMELKYITAAHLKLAGNCYWYLDGVKSPTDTPQSIHPFQPGSMRVKLDKSRFPFRLSHYEYTLEGKIYRFEPYQVLHIKIPDPSDPFVGLGVPQTIPVWIDSDNYAMEYNRKFFKNGANVGTYISTDTNVEANIERIRQGWQQRQAGVENAHKTPVLPKGVKLEHSGVTQRDMDFSNLTDKTRDRILSGFRTPKTILGASESETNRATAETADYVFSKRTVKPLMTLICAYLNEFLIPRYGDDLLLSFLDPTPEDRAKLMDEMTKGVGGLPVITQNEARETYHDLPPIEGGDDLMVPAGYVPAGTPPAVDPNMPSDTPKEDTGKGKKSKPFVRKAKTVQGWSASAIRVRTGGKTPHSAAHKVRKALMDAAKKRIESDTAFQTVKNFNDLTKEEYGEYYKRFQARTETAREQLHNDFLGINGRQKIEVLENLPAEVGGRMTKRAIKAATKSLDDLFDIREWIGITIDLVSPIVTSLAKDEAAAALAMIGARQQDILANDETARALDELISKMSRSYNETTLDQLKKVLTEKLTQEGGTNLAELTDAVEGVYSFADERRAGLIAKTEAYRTSNWANREAWEKSGVVKSLKWYTAEDQKVCPQCSDLDGKQVGIEDEFFHDDYSDGMTPPAHPDCRCYVRPEVVA